MAQPEAISFRPVTEADLPTLAGWLRQPHLVEWWGDPDEELDLIRETIKGSDGTEGFLFLIDGEPAGYIQSWLPERYAHDAKWLAEAPWLARVPKGALGIDIFVGDPECVGRGAGSAALSAFCRRLFAAGAPHLIIDPDSANLRAVRCYAKAGFRPYDRHEGPKETTLLMELRPEDMTA